MLRAPAPTKSSTSKRWSNATTLSSSKSRGVSPSDASRPNPRTSRFSNKPRPSFRNRQLSTSRSRMIKTARSLGTNLHRIATFSLLTPCSNGSSSRDPSQRTLALLNYKLRLSLKCLPSENCRRNLWTKCQSVFLTICLRILRNHSRSKLARPSMLRAVSRLRRDSLGRNLLWKPS